MEGLERLKRKIENARDLLSVVKIMKTISASNIREYEQAVESLSEFNKTIEMGFQIIMRNEPEVLASLKSAEKKKRLGAVIFGSDQGLCGSFNEQIASFAVKKMDEIGKEGRVALAVGERVVSRLREAGQPTEAFFLFYGEHQAIAEVMTDVLAKIEEWRLERKIDQIVLFYNRSLSGAAFEPHMIQLFPLDLEWLNALAEKEWLSRTIPTLFMDVDQLFSSMVRQYLFFSLYSAFVESLASENASRLSSMQMAEKNIEEHLEDLDVQFNRLRQEAITSELLDVVTGFEALTGK
jgi:F-type H+-transporting ATPase subunit gamma